LISQVQQKVAPDDYGSLSVKIIGTERQKRVRLAELAVVVDMLFPRTQEASEPFTVVEIGGGSGFLAREISLTGAEVVCTDPAPRCPLDYPVVAAFAHELPLANHTCDRLFASHVLEHIPGPFLGPTFQEMHRLLKPGGRVVVMLPTSFAMALTIVLQPLGHARNLVIHLFRALGLGTAPESRVSNNPLSPKGERLGLRAVKALTVRWVLPAPHGVGKTAFHEMWNWRRSRWIQLFGRFGFKTVEIRSSGLAVSNHQLFDTAFWGLRELLGRLGMAGTNAFVLHCAHNKDDPSPRGTRDQPRRHKDTKGIDPG